MKAQADLQSMVFPLRAPTLPSPENQATLLQESLANAIKHNFAVNKTTGSSFLSFMTVGLSTPLVPDNVPVSCCYCRAVFNIFLISPIP